MSIVFGFFFLGHIVKAFQNNFAFIISVSGSNAYQISPWLFNLVSKRVSKRVSRVVAFIIDLSVSRVRGMPGMLSLRSCIAQFHPKHNAFKRVSKQLCVYLLYRSVFLAQTRFRSPFFPRLRNAFLTP